MIMEGRRSIAPPLVKLGLAVEPSAQPLAFLGRFTLETMHRGWNHRDHDDSAYVSDLGRNDDSIQSWVRSTTMCRLFSETIFLRLALATLLLLVLLACVIGVDPFILAQDSRAFWLLLPAALAASCSYWPVAANGYVMSRTRHLIHVTDRANLAKIVRSDGTVHLRPSKGPYVNAGATGDENLYLFRCMPSKLARFVNLWRRTAVDDPCYIVIDLQDMQRPFRFRPIDGSLIVSGGYVGPACVRS